jgi:hypothetical protein
MHCCVASDDRVIFKAGLLAVKPMKIFCTADRWQHPLCLINTALKSPTYKQTLPMYHYLCFWAVAGVPRDTKIDVPLTITT